MPSESQPRQKGKPRRRLHSPMGERDAVRKKSRQSVTHSDLELTVGLTLPPTAGRTPEARPPVSPRESGAACQRQSGPGCGTGSPAERAEREAPALKHLDEYQISLLRQFFDILHRWKREAEHAN